MGKAVIDIDLLKIIDKVIDRKANDDTSLQEFSELIKKEETIKKVIKPKKQK